MAIPRRLQWSGREREVTLLDLSEGGARLAAVPGLLAGAMVMLPLCGIAGPLPARLVEADARRLGLAFHLAAAQQEALPALLETRRCDMKPDE